MTTTIDRAEINRRNSTRSTGPRSPEGKLRSKYNAVKHGMSAATPVLPGEDPDAFRDRLDAWAEALDPDNVVEQFLVEQAATTSWKIERAHRVETARLAAILRSVPAGQARREIDEAEALGRQLLGLDVEPPPRSGPAPGSGGPIATTPAASSPSGSAEGRKGPREIVRPPRIVGRRLPMAAGPMGRPPRDPRPRRELVERRPGHGGLPAGAGARAAGGGGLGLPPAQGAGPR